jgi:hypothetical protein
MERRAAPLPVNDWASSITATATITAAMNVKRLDPRHAPHSAPVQQRLALKSPLPILYRSATQPGKTPTQIS